jgi:hypothetical protein
MCFSSRMIVHVLKKQKHHVWFKQLCVCLLPVPKKQKHQNCFLSKIVNCPIRFLWQLDIVNVIQRNPVTKALAWALRTGDKSAMSWWLIVMSFRGSVGKSKLHTQACKHTLHFILFWQFMTGRSDSIDCSTILCTLTLTWKCMQDVITCVCERVTWQSFTQ